MLNGLTNATTATINNTKAIKKVLYKVLKNDEASNFMYD